MKPIEVYDNLARRLHDSREVKLRPYTGAYSTVSTIDVLMERLYHAPDYLIIEGRRYTFNQFGTVR